MAKGLKYENLLDLLAQQVCKYTFKYGVKKTIQAFFDHSGYEMQTGKEIPLNPESKMVLKAIF